MDELEEKAHDMNRKYLKRLLKALPNQGGIISGTDEELKASAASSVSRLP
jgi:hypothetical protein